MDIGNLTTGAYDLPTDFGRPLTLCRALSDALRPVERVVADVDLKASCASAQPCERAWKWSAKHVVLIEVPLEHSFELWRFFLGSTNANLWRRRSVPIEIDNGNTEGVRRLARLASLLLQLIQHGLDVLAGPELVGRKIRTGASVDAIRHRSDLHAILARYTPGW